MILYEDLVSLLGPRSIAFWYDTPARKKVLARMLAGHHLPARLRAQKQTRKRI